MVRMRACYDILAKHECPMKQPFLEYEGRIILRSLRTHTL